MSVRGVRTPVSAREVVSSKSKMKERLEDIGARFGRVWLFEYLEKLKDPDIVDTAKYFEKVCENSSPQPKQSDKTKTDAWDDLLVVYGPRDKDPEKSWEVSALLDLSMKASKYYRLAIFFMSGDRTVGWWSSGDPRFLVVCLLRGVGNRVKGPRGSGRLSMKFEPDGLFRGCMEMSAGEKIQCRLSHVKQLFDFGSQDADSAWEYLASALLVSGIAFALTLVDRPKTLASGETVRDYGFRYTAELSLSGLLVVIGQQHWPGFYLAIRTCAMGAFGGVSGVLVSKRCYDVDCYIHDVELPVAVIGALILGGDNGWKYVVGLSTFFLVPVYWSAFFRSRCGEGCFWRHFLNDRHFLVADAVCESNTEKFGRRPVYTRFKNFDGTTDVKCMREKENGERKRLKYPPAYARGFGFYDMSSWGVGKTPNKQWTKYSYCACAVYVVELLLALLALACGTAGCGLAVFLPTGLVSTFRSSDGSSLYLRKREMIIGVASGWLSSCALMGVFLSDGEAHLSQMAYGSFLFCAWAFLLGLVFQILASLLAFASHCCLSQRKTLAEKSRTDQKVVARNESWTDNWENVFNCRRTVQTTFPREDGFSYYDGPQFNVRSGWYFPACGRVALSVPRSRGHRLGTAIDDNDSQSLEEYPRFGSFARTRETGVLLGPSAKHRVAGVREAGKASF